MKRLLALLMCLVMVLSLIPAAAAEDIEIIEIETGREDIPEDTGEEELIAIIDPEETLTPPGDELMRIWPTINIHPSSVKAYVGTTAKFTVSATCATAYQWYYRTSSSGSWAKSTTTGATTATLSVAAETRRSGYQYRCKVSNSAGYVYTEAATLTVTKKPVITAQPESLTIITGGTATFAVKADGATAYQWYWRANAEDSWHKSTVSTAGKATLVYTNLSSSKSGRQYKCKVSNDAGYVYSAVATLSVEKKPAITQQPESLTIGAGGTAKFTVKADGATAYQWYWRANKNDSWHKSTLATAKAVSLVCENMAYSRTGRQYKCKVSTAEGYVYSSIVTLTVLEKPVITAQPASAMIHAGGTATFTVSADGATAYQWYWRANAEDSWHKSTVSAGTTAALIYTNLGSEKSGRQYKCKVSNAKGYVYSKVATLTVSEKPVITTEPLSCTAGTGATVRFKVKASGANSYQWQYRTSSTDTWKNSSLNGSKTDTLTVSATMARNGYEYRCVLENANGTVRSRKAVLTVVDKQCGENLTWTLDSNGLLTISGEGEMYALGELVYYTPDEANFVDYSPWKKTKVCEVLIENGVSTIGPFAFLSCINLTRVTIPDSVTEIGTEAFYYCANLTSVTIPDSVGFVDSSAFKNCCGLTNVTLPNGLTRIWSYLFYGCTNLTSVTIPNSVTSIDAYAFSDCTNLTNVTLPDNLTSIGPYVFSNCGGLTNMTIPDSVTNIGEDAFFRCTGLANVTIGNGVKDIGYGAFRYCTNLTNVSIGNGLKSLGYHAFMGCSGLTTIIVGKGNTNFSSQDGVLFNKDKTELLFYPGAKSGAYTIPDSVIGIDINAFSDCTGLTDVTIGNGVTDIDNHVFSQCSSLTTITVSDGNLNYSSEDGVLFNKDKTVLLCGPRGRGGAYMIPDSVTGIENRAFERCTGLVSVTIPDGVTSVGGGVFYGCESLETAIIGQGVTGLEYAYSYENGMSYGFFEGCRALRSVTIPDSVTSIGKSAFKNCGSLTSVTLPDSVTSIEAYAFCQCNSLTNVTLPDSLTSIEAYAFCQCNSLTSVTIPNSVTSIGNGAFCCCDSLTSMTIPDSVTSIGDEAFQGCSRLTSVTIGKGVTSIESEMFCDCSSLTSITIPDGVTSIRYYAFHGCSSLTSMTIPDSVTSIELSAFEECSNLSDVYYKGTKTQWGKIDIGDYNDPLLKATIHYNA